MDAGNGRHGDEEVGVGLLERSRRPHGRLGAGACVPWHQFVVAELAVRLWLRLTLIPVLFVCGAGVSCKRNPAAEPGWKEYSYADDGFALSAPAQPTLEKQQQPTASGSIEMRQYSVDLTSDVQVMMSVSDFPNTNHAAPKDVLEGAVNGSVQNTKATKTSEKDIELQQVPGIEFEAATGGYRLLGRYYWKNNRLFALMAVSPTGQSVAPDELRVLDSLRFVTK